MQLSATGDSLFGNVGPGGGSGPEFEVLWPSNSSEDVIRCVVRPITTRYLLSTATWSMCPLALHG
jgi:hypothetical protein